MTNLAGLSTADLTAELERRGAMRRCGCGKWSAYLGAYDRDGYTLRPPCGREMYLLTRRRARVGR
jgi:hypothetical protein